MKLSFIKKFIVGAASVGLLILPASYSYAQQEGASGLSISPTRTELSIKPGQAGTVSLRVKNITKGEVTAKAIVNDFEPDNITGEPKLLTDGTKRSSSSIIDFLIGFDDFVLAPGEEKEVNIGIQIPSDGAPGAYYGVIRYQAIPGSTGEQAPGQVALTASVGSLVLIEVPGNITEKIQLQNVKAYLNDSSGSIFVKVPTKVGVQIKNLGNSFSKPFGTVQVLNIKDKEVYSYEINNTTPRGNILPDSERLFKDDLKNVKTPGRYKIVANISYGNGGEVLNYTTTFWYLPIWLLATLAVVLAVLVVSATYVFKRYRSRSISHRRKS